MKGLKCCKNGNNYSRKITVVIFYLLKMNKFDVLKFMQKPVKSFLYLQFKQKNKFRNNYSRKITAQKLEHRRFLVVS